MKEEIFFFLKQVSDPSNPPDELAQNVSKKIPFGRIVPLFSSKVQNSSVFNYLHDSNSIFRVRRLNSEIFSDGTITPSQSSTPTSFQQTLVTFHQIQPILIPVLCYMSLRTMRPWLRWLSKVEVPQWDMFHGPTELLWIGCLIQIRYIDTKHQLADMLTKGNFTRDEWNNILHLLNTSHFSCLCCAKNFRLTSCIKTTTKEIQNQKEEERVVSKSRPAVMNMSPPHRVRLHLKVRGCR